MLLPFGPIAMAARERTILVHLVIGVIAALRHSALVTISRKKTVASLYHSFAYRRVLLRSGGRLGYIRLSEYSFLLIRSSYVGVPWGSTRERAPIGHFASAKTCRFSNAWKRSDASSVSRRRDGAFLGLWLAATVQKATPISPEVRLTTLIKRFAR
jgi:hypothetical protein